jgi:hypothetical protein
MHDGDSRAHTTARVLDEVIPKLKARGFRFETLATPEPNQAPEPTRGTGAVLFFQSRWPRAAQLQRSTTRSLEKKPE